MKRFLLFLTVASFLHATYTAVPAAQLPAGTTLTINPGFGNQNMFSITQPGTGSAFSIPCCGPTPLWGDIPANAVGGAGTDGGIVIGTNQSSGGEDLATGLMTPGGIDAAWYFINIYGTDFTPAGATLNTFADTSCVAGLGTTACTDETGDVTTVGSWEIAANGGSSADNFPFGRTVDSWLVSGNLYSLDYRMKVPLCPGCFGYIVYSLHLEGSIIIPLTPFPTNTPVDTATPTSTRTPTPTNTPTNTPTTCEARWPVTTIATFGKGRNVANNTKVSHAITGNIVNPGSYGPTSSKIALCAGTSVSVVVTDTTGTPAVTADSPGIQCAPSGCSVVSLTAMERYIAVSSDGTDIDRISLLAR